MCVFPAPFSWALLHLADLIGARSICGRMLLAAGVALRWLEEMAEASVRCPWCGWWMSREPIKQAHRCLLCGSWWSERDRLSQEVETHG